MFPHAHIPFSGSSGLEHIRALFSERMCQNGNLKVNLAKRSLAREQTHEENTCFRCFKWCILLHKWSCSLTQIINYTASMNALTFHRRLAAVLYPTCLHAMFFHLLEALCQPFCSFLVCVCVYVCVCVCACACVRACVRVCKSPKQQPLTQY